MSIPPAASLGGHWQVLQGRPFALSYSHATHDRYSSRNSCFRQDGSIDEPALRNLVAWQVESGIDFLVPCGTTGETPTLSHDEWLRVIDVTIEVVAGRVRRGGRDFQLDP